MTSINNWTIVGDNALADDLRRAARFQPAPTSLTIVTEGSEAPADAFVLGPAIFTTQAKRVVPWYAAFEAVEEVKRGVDAGELGRRFGCFISYRLPRGQFGEAVTYNALLPSLALALDVTPGRVSRAAAMRASLFAEHDAWFVTLRFADDTIATVEALSACDPAQGGELLIEVTGSDRVLRAEPFRQAVVVERLGGAPEHKPWWEDVAERYLQLVARRALQPVDDEVARLRAVWAAVLQSAQDGGPVALD